MEVAERFADGQANEQERIAAFQRADDVLGGLLAIQDDGGEELDVSFEELDRFRKLVESAGVDPGAAEHAAAGALDAVDLKQLGAAALCAGWAAVDARPAGVSEVKAEEIEAAAQASLLREIFGCLPFRSVSINPSWLAWNDATVSRIAKSIYDDRSFAGLPILADALEEAGCCDAEILGHLRGPGPHVRGCWVVDRLLGKE